MDTMLRRGGYRVMVDGAERAQIAARHWGDAAALLHYRESGNDAWEPTPFQVADARHSPIKAVLVIDEWLERNWGQGFLAEGEEFELVDIEDEENDEETA